MRETVLLINFQDEKQLRDLKMILFTLKIRMKKVEKKEYLQQIGFLAGMKNMEAAPECYEGEELEKEDGIRWNIESKAGPDSFYDEKKWSEASGL